MALLTCIKRGLQVVEQLRLPVHLEVSGRCLGYVATNIDQFPNISEANSMEFEFTRNKSGFKTRLPGWDVNDINVIGKDLRQTPYVRSWKVLEKMDFLREMARTERFLDALKLEENHVILIKGANLERVVPYARLVSLGGGPYAYDLDFKSHLSRIGRTSFQIDNSVSLADSDEELFRSSLLCVLADSDSNASNVPSWWKEKHITETSMSNCKPLHVTLGKDIVLDDYEVLHRSRYQTRYSEIDRNGNVSGPIFMEYCAEAISNAFKDKEVPGMRSLAVLENASKNITVEFLRGLKLGDTVVASVMRKPDAPNVIVCVLHDNGKMVFVQKVEYDLNETTGVKM